MADIRSVITFVVRIAVKYDHREAVLLKRLVHVHFTERQRTHTAIALVRIHRSYVDDILKVSFDGRFLYHPYVRLATRLGADDVRLLVTECTDLYLLLIPKSDSPPKVIGQFDSFRQSLKLVLLRIDIIDVSILRSISPFNVPTGVSEVLVVVDILKLVGN